MSEFINNTENRVKELLAFVTGLIKGEKGSELIKQYEHAIEEVQSFDVVMMVDKLMQKDFDLQEVKQGINRALNMLYKGLVSAEVPACNSIPFLDSLISENNELNHRLIELRPLIKGFNQKDISEEKRREILEEISDKIYELQQFEVHYVKKENILFPYIEKHLKEYGCLPLMWSYHDDIRRLNKEITNIIAHEKVDLKRLNRLLGDLFFVMYAIRFREEYILFPVIYSLIPDDCWDEMMKQAMEEGFAFIEAPKIKTIARKQKKPDAREAGGNVISDLDVMLDMGTGMLKLEQVVMMLNHLPVDMTYVDENDAVRYFSTPGHRIFPRSKAIVGRLVENCHPPSSVHIVKQLLDAFKAGTKNKESFWIQMGDKFILIQYFALRDAEGKYRGTLEVSQDVSEIRKLNGEKRLMEE